MKAKDHGAIFDLPHLYKHHKKEYDLWRGLFKKKYDVGWLSRNPTYVGTDFDESWKRFSTFLSDIQSMVGYDEFLKGGWQFDKDILVKGNQVYSKNTCCFVPNTINKLLTSRKRFRGKHPIGVTWIERDKAFIAQLSICGKQKILGYFKTSEEAYLKYKLEKEAEIKRVAEEYRHVLDPKVFDSLYNWEIEKDD